MVAWPTPADLREHWPRLAMQLFDEDGVPIDPRLVSDYDDAEYVASGLILAALDVDLAGANSTAAELELLSIDPPREERAPWRGLYGPELATHHGVARALASRDPVAATAFRAGLPPAELDVLRAWAAGSSLRTISRDLHRQPRTVRTLLERARERLRSLDRRMPCSTPADKVGEEPCRTAPETSSLTSSPGSSAMRAAS